MPRNQKRDTKGRFVRWNDKLTLKQMETIEFMVYNSDTSITEVCRQMDISRTCLYRWLNDEEFNKEFSKAKETYIKGMSAKALKKIESLMNSKDSRTALKAAERILQQTQDFTSDVQVNTHQEIVITLADEYVGVD